MLVRPKVTIALRDNRLDGIFKVTGDLLQGCQNVVNCTNCTITCTDLLLMMTVLQETHSCFDHIAKCELDGPVRLSFGDYQVLSTHTDFRVTLVRDLVKRANDLLTAINTKGQRMMEELKEPCRLAKANMAYLNETIDHSRTVLRCVTRLVESAGD